MDVADPFSATNTRNRYALVVMDYFSKWPEVYAIPNQKTSAIVNVVNNWVCRHGVSIKAEISSQMFSRKCMKYTVLKRTTPLHPQSDRMVERFNRGTLAQLKVDKRVLIYTPQSPWSSR